MKNKIFALILSFFLCVPAMAYHWEPISFGGGGAYPMIVADKFTEDKAYAVSDVNIPFVTTNKGELWDFITDASHGFDIGQPTALTQSGQNSNLLYMIGNSNINKSVDGGTNWTKVSSLKATRTSSGKVIMIDPTDDETIVAAPDTGLIVESTDGGATWPTLYEPFLTVNTESAELSGSGQTRTGTLNSTTNIKPGTITFTSTNGEIFTDNGAGVLVSNTPGGSGTITYSNGKYSLTFVAAPASTSVTYTVRAKASFVFVNKSGTKIFSGYGGGLSVYNRGTGVNTRVTLTGTNATRNYDYDTHEDPSGNEFICVTAGLTLACSDSDDGATWTYTSPTVTGGSASTFMNFRLSTTYLESGEVRFTVFRRLISNSSSSSVQQYSMDSGVTWGTSTTIKNSTMNPTEAMTAGGWHGNSMECDNFDEDVCYFSTNWNIFRSDDGGITYHEKVVGAANIVTSDVKIAPNGWIFKSNMDNGVQYSTDGGTSWTQAWPTSSSAGGHYWRILLSGDEEDWNNDAGVVVTMSNYWNDMKPRIHRSANNGRPGTWTTITAGLPSVAMAGDVIWPNFINGFGGMIRSASVSADGQTMIVGIDGENCNVDGSGGLPSDCDYPKNGEMPNGVSGGAFKSTDAGLTWARANGFSSTHGISTPRKFYNGIAIDPKNASRVLLGTFGYNLYLSTNAALTATYLGIGMNSVYDVYYDKDGHPYAVGSSSGPVIYQSIIAQGGAGNGAAGTWIRMKRLSPSSVTTGIADGIVADPNNTERLIVGITLGPAAHRKVWMTPNKSNNASASWIDITGDLKAMGGCQAFAIDPDAGTEGKLYCASNGGGLHVLDMAELPDEAPAIDPPVEAGVTILGGSN